jgi:hypothetical protein
MNQNHLRVNRSFMLMNAILAFALFVIVGLFLYISFRFQRGADRQVRGRYAVTVSSALSGDSLSLYLNDSLLYSRRIPQEGCVDTVVPLTRDNSFLLVAHSDSDRVAAITMKEEFGDVVIEKDEEGTVVFRE